MSSPAPEEANPPATPKTLTEVQQKAFEEFRDLCEKNGQVWSVSKAEGKGSCQRNDDLILLQYLRARGYDPQAALKQYSASTLWRKETGLVDEYDNTEIDSFETMRRVFPQWTGRRDLNGSPLSVYVVAEVKPDDISAMKAADPEFRTVFLPNEYTTQFLLPLCGKLRQDRVVSSSICIADLSGIGIRQFWNLHAQLKKSSEIGIAHYPETVEKIFVVGAPFFFSTIWSYVTQWFDPATVNKISVLSKAEVTSSLSKFIAIENIPKRYGGKHEWDFGMQPLVDDEVRKLVPGIEEHGFVGPIRWFNDTIMAVGKENGKERRTVMGRTDTLSKTPEVEEKQRLSLTEVNISTGVF